MQMPALHRNISLDSMHPTNKDASVSSVNKVFATGFRAPSGVQSQFLVGDGQADGGAQFSPLKMAERLHPTAPVIAVKHRRHHRRSITADLSCTRYVVVRQMAEKMGFTIAKDDDPNAYLIWNDSLVSTDKVSELKSYQHFNHFPGMSEISRKDCLARNMLKMKKHFPEDYRFFPNTWILPADYALLQNYAKDMKSKKKSKTFIFKPANGAQGHGICLYRNAEKIPLSDHFIVQEYIEKPLLLEGFKFDLRVYTLVTSCDPLRIFLFHDGLVRLATEKYSLPHESNISHLFMHLTNYSVNKHSEHYKRDMATDSGSKRSIRYLNNYLHTSDIDVALLWRNIADMITKTLLVGQPHVLHAYRMCRSGASLHTDSVCFEVLGFDVLIDDRLRPWLLEINRSPSYGTDEKLDFDIKSALVEDTLRLLNIKVSDKRRNIAAQKMETQNRLFRSHKKVHQPENLTVNQKKETTERKKCRLTDLLSKVRKVSRTEEFENRNCGRFRRIFPCDDLGRQERYCEILRAALNVFMSGRSSSMQKEIVDDYSNTLKEGEILDMLADCESESQGHFSFPDQTMELQPLHSMPEIVPNLRRDDDEFDEEARSDDDRFLPSLAYNSQTHSPFSSGSRHVTLHDIHGMGESALWQSSGLGRQRSSGLMIGGSSSSVIRQMRRQSDSGVTVCKGTGALTLADTHPPTEQEQVLAKKTLVLLNEMRIKFPGKTDTEAELILDQLNENWKFHKPRIASYWLVKLDSIKRRKVVDIVKNNTMAILQRVWHSPDVNNLRLSRLFGRLFNRLQWSHGQGLWNCFSSMSRNSWEKIFSRRTDSLTESEMNCCRRLVQLCQDCLMIVYQFAADTKTAITPALAPAAFGEEAVLRAPPANQRRKGPGHWNTHTFSQRYSKLYPDQLEQSGL